MRDTLHLLVCLTAWWWLGGIGGHAQQPSPSFEPRMPVKRYFDDTRTLLPPKSTIRIWNPRGDIRVRIVARPDVTITAARHAAPGPPVRAEEVILEELPNQLNITTDPPETVTGVDLDVLVPENTYLRLFSEVGKVRVEGLPAGLIATAYRSDIELYLPLDGDADVTWTSVHGAVRTELPLKQFGTPDNRMLHGQMGRGGAILVAQADRGDIVAKPLPPNADRRERPALQRPAVVSAAAGAEEPFSASDGGDVVLEATLVMLNAVITTPNGVPIRGLQPTDFVVLEDGEPQDVSYFGALETPFNLVLLLDLSGSTREKLAVIRRAALGFLGALRPEDRMAVVTFSDTARLICPLTNDRRKLRERIDDIRRPEGGTNFYDALAGTIKSVLRDVRGERNAVVIVTDGMDNVLPPGGPEYGSVTTYEELRALAQECDAMLLPIYLDTEAEVVERYGPRARIGYAIARNQLRELATLTGGRMFYAATVEDLESCYTAVAAELRAVYSFGYYPKDARRDGRFRRIQVKVRREGAVVRTRRGYVMPK
ncbi:MAG: VWA domain-containing protein [Chloracidobacterium sp.]|nr:VWA domain-containing protein [Chloracidobacterium sp.]MDW8216472.1 VWA domain-containing protein [Acidobacteriota bacterium]